MYEGKKSGTKFPYAEPASSGEIFRNPVNHCPLSPSDHIHQGGHAIVARPFRNAGVICGDLHIAEVCEGTSQQVFCIEFLSGFRTTGPIFYLPKAITFDQNQPAGPYGPANAFEDACAVGWRKELEENSDNDVILIFLPLAGSEI